MAYFRVAVSPDDGLAFERIVNVPKRGLGDKATQEINRCARDNGVSLIEGARILAAERGLPARACGQLGALVADFDRWHALLRAETDHVELAEQILERVRLHRHVAGGKIPRRRRPAGEPQGTGQGAERVREPAGLPRTRRPRDGQRAGRRRRQGLDHDPARRQGPRIPLRLPARLGGRPVPVAALDGRERRQGPRRGTPPRLCRHHPRAALLHHLLRRQPPGLQPVAIRAAVALHRRTAARACRGADPARPLWRRLRRGGAATGQHTGRQRRQGRCLQFPRLAAHAGRAATPARCRNRKRRATW